MNQNLQNRIVNDLYIFYRVFVASNFEKNLHAPHIQRLAKALTNLTYNPNSKNRLAISMPPQHSKSSMATVAYSCWLTCRNPKTRILIINAEDGLATDFGLQIFQLMSMVGPYFGIKISKKKHSTKDMRFEVDGKLQGGIKLTGAHGGITGRPADVILVDDPYKGILDITPTQLQNKIDWYTDIVEQRVRTDTKLVLLHTRWHSNDLIGFVKREQPEKYHFLSFPAISKTGKPLWPQAYSLEFYKDKEKTTGERVFQARYQQKPLDLTSNFFYTDHIIWEDHFPNQNHAIHKCRSWDIASSDETSKSKRAFTAGVPMYKISENEYWITDFVYGKFGKQTGDVVVNQVKKDGVSWVSLIEPGTVGGAAQLLYEEWRKRLKGYRTIQSLPIGTKSDRATPFADAVYDGKIHVYINNNELRQEFITQLETFPNSENADIVDSCAYAYNFLKDKGDISGIYGTGNTNY